MDLVLGLSITSAAVRLVLVEGATGEGDTVDHDIIDTVTAADARALLHNRVIVGAQRNKLHSIGVTWTAEAAGDGSRVLDALASGGFENFLAVSECDAVDALAAGIAGLSGDDVGVGIVEPEAAVVAVVNPQGALVDRIDRRLHGGDAAELVATLVPMFDPGGWTPEAIFVFGSADDLDVVLSMLRGAVAAPVVSAADPDLALAKGAALAAAQAMSGWEARVAPIAVTDDAPQLDDDAPAASASRRPRLSPKVTALTSVLAAAVLTFVISLSLALGLHLTPQADEPEVANASGQPTVAAKAPVVEAAPQPPAAPPPVEAALPPSKTVGAEAAPAPEAEPVFDAPEAAPVEPPPVYGPVEPVPAAPAPEPVYVPPAPAPVYVPPNTPAYTPPPEPRLRDRILEKIPIINRFHDPQPQ